VPLDVQSPQGESAGASSTAIRSESGDVPANTAISSGALNESQRSPPFSTITSSQPKLAFNAFPTCSAIAPATAAMGPTPAATPALSIARTTGGAAGSSGSGERLLRKFSWVRLKVTASSPGDSGGKGDVSGEGGSGGRYPSIWARASSSAPRAASSISGRQESGETPIQRSLSLCESTHERKRLPIMSR